jgi:hypothetical protein
MTMAALSHPSAALSMMRISSSVGISNLRFGLFSGLARVPRNGFRSSVCLRSNQVQREFAAATISLMVEAALPSAFKDSIQSSAKAGVSSRVESPCFVHQTSSLSKASEYSCFVRGEPVRPVVAEGRKDELRKGADLDKVD